MFVPCGYSKHRRQPLLLYQTKDDSLDDYYHYYYNSKERERENPSVCVLASVLAPFLFLHSSQKYLWKLISLMWLVLRLQLLPLQLCRYDGTPAPALRKQPNGKVANREPEFMLLNLVFVAQHRCYQLNNRRYISKTEKKVPLLHPLLLLLINLDPRVSMIAQLGLKQSAFFSIRLTAA